ncbi:hypothetical protein HNR62_001056 [Oceanisphaera litoralis]|uniref:hypothetical protein n=1 Tax=Oceanisphaera litoralis TaxID=225144 RepID=UPI00195DE880|nr:hypothetical protein [Oceanisphaera litoralis]MBM7455196.1 hypothetical protein [Oceanisphaera litoralis]
MSKLGTAKPNENAIKVVKAAHQHGGWLGFTEVAALTGLSERQAADAIVRATMMGDEWCGRTGWDERMVKSEAGGVRSEIKIIAILALPSISAHFASDRVKQILIDNPGRQYTLSQLAQMADCSPGTASYARKTFRQYGPAGKPPKPKAKRSAKVKRQQDMANSLIHKDEVVGGEMSRRFRQLWPAPATAGRAQA